MEFLPASFAAVVIGAPLAVGVAELDHRHGLEDLVDLPVALAGEPVPNVIAGGGIDRGGTGRGGEVVPVREAGDVTDLDQQFRCSGRDDVETGCRGGEQAHVDQAPPLMPPQLWDVLDACPVTTAWTSRPQQPSLAGARDRCLLLVGFFDAFRRSELARIRIEDLHEDSRGMVVELPWSKTNQYGTRSDLVALPRLGNPDRCPVRAIETWCALAGLTDGLLFRRVTKGNRPGASLSDAGFNQLVIQAAKRAGISATMGGDTDGEGSTRRRAPYSAHSLRAGFVTYAHSRGATASQIAHQTRHASLASVRTYTRLSSVWDDNAVTALGL